jgi:dihydropteroate synthase
LDGGKDFDHAAAVAPGRAMVDEGADIVDVGGESSRPGAQPVDEGEELRRVEPVVRALGDTVRISIDTMKPSVARAAIGAGASLVNDVGGRLTEVAAEAGVGLVIMHMRGEPPDMQRDPRYHDVVAEVSAWLGERAELARRAGIEEIYVDPGIGFGKTAAHNLALLRALPELVAKGTPVLVGTSRKSFLGRMGSDASGPALPPGERFEPSRATALWAMAAGAAIVRVHDVAASVAGARLVGEPIEAVSGLAQVAGVGR